MNEWIVVGHGRPSIKDVEIGFVQNLHPLESTIETETSRPRSLPFPSLKLQNSHLRISEFLNFQAFSSFLGKFPNGLFMKIL